MIHRPDWKESFLQHLIPGIILLQMKPACSFLAGDTKLQIIYSAKSCTFDEREEKRPERLGETLLKKRPSLLGSIITGGASDLIINLVKGAAGILYDDKETIKKQLSNHPVLTVKLKELEAANKMQLQELVLHIVEVMIN